MYQAICTDRIFNYQQTKFANILAGIDYPFPVVDHVKASEANLKKLLDFRSKQAETVKLTTGKSNF